MFALAVVPALMSSVPVDAASVARLQADATAASAATTEQVRALPGFGQWLAGLAPANVIRAAADGAMLPLIVFTLLFALALRRITPDRRDHVLRVFDGIGAAMLQIVRWLIALAPIGVFTLVAPTTARLGVSLAGALGYYVLMYSAMMIGLGLCCARWCVGRRRGCGGSSARPAGAGGGIQLELVMASLALIVRPAGWTCRRRRLASCCHSRCHRSRS